MEANKKKVELLAPAGNYEALTGAFAAGADAVYLGGDAFGARAYAENFTQEEICEGIRTAHLLGKKIYLTVNTLVKERELEKLYYFLLPFYEAGLDGAIVQDLGVLCFIRSHFPDLPLHASTQMTVTSAYGAELLAKEGIKRIVPARELSLAEIKKIKDRADVEIETFIHGAMCYCYSGQCLFSSLLGGRSGNRGRCAQPCRLPYRTDQGKEAYPLSMKDMCTLSILPELIEAGIDSFKIEGRMKKPEYAAGVTAVYRKYMDRYERDPEAFQIEKKDLDFLGSLYIRSEIGEGYYHRHNGREMITLASPSYSANDESVLSGIRSKYIEPGPRIIVKAAAVLRAGREAQMSVSAGDCTAVCQGDLVQEAAKQPLSPEKIREQLTKSGDALFEIRSLDLTMDENIFMPVSGLNRLRRQALSMLRERLLCRNSPAWTGEKAEALQEKGCCGNLAGAPDKRERPSAGQVSSQERLAETPIHVLVSTREQLFEAALTGVPRIYLDKMEIDDALCARLDALRNEKCEFYLAFPYIVRDKDEGRMEELCRLLETELFDGALIRNLETLSFLRDRQIKKPIAADQNLYVWNSGAYEFYAEKVRELTLPAELNSHEISELSERINDEKCRMTTLVYGRLPMMISAGCIRKTMKSCGRSFELLTLTDRYGKEFPVYTDCGFCYNIIYNSVPLSLHKLFLNKRRTLSVCRLDFTVESGGECAEIIRYFQSLRRQYRNPFYKDFTAGHYNRGVE